MDEEVYILPPAGYTKAEGKVCRLKRSLYGLKQASRQWNKEFISFLLKQGFVQSKQDYSLFTKGSGSNFIAVQVYVDDVLITGGNSSDIQLLKNALDQAFTIKDLGCMRYFLGIEVARSSAGTLLNQRKYILDILQDAGMTACKPADFPLPTNLRLTIDQGELLSHPEVYRRLVGRLLYLNITRPDISYAVQHLSQFLSQPRHPHMQAALHLLRYLKGSIGVGLFYPANSTLCLKAYTDADWARCMSSRKSLTGYCLFLGDSLISWKTKKQKTVSKSSAESEYRAMSETASEIEWMIGILRDLQVPLQLPLTLYCDNKAAQYIAANPVFHNRTKHLDINCHYVRDKIKEGLIQTAHISSHDQLADIMTKPLPTQQHHALALKLGLVFPSKSNLRGG